MGRIAISVALALTVASCASQSGMVQHDAGPPVDAPPAPRPIPRYVHCSGCVVEGVMMRSIGWVATCAPSDFSAERCDLCVVICRDRMLDLQDPEDEQPVCSNADDCMCDSGYNPGCYKRNPALDGGGADGGT